MQKFRFEQKKNMKLREYLRKEKEKIISSREESEEERVATPELDLNDERNKALSD